SAPTGTPITGRANDSPTRSQLTWAGAAGRASPSSTTIRYGARVGFLISASGFSIRSTKPLAITGPRSGAGGSSSLPTTVPAAAGIAISPLADSFGAAGGAPWLRWLVVAAMMVAARRHRALVLAAGFALGAARGARPPVVAPGGVVIDDRGPDRVIGVVRGPI